MYEKVDFSSIVFFYLVITVAGQIESCRPGKTEQVRQNRLDRTC